MICRKKSEQVTEYMARTFLVEPTKTGYGEILKLTRSGDRLEVNGCVVNASTDINRKDCGDIILSEKDKLVSH